MAAPGDMNIIYPQKIKVSESEDAVDVVEKGVPSKYQINLEAIPC